MVKKNVLKSVGSRKKLFLKRIIVMGARRFVLITLIKSMFKRSTPLHHLICLVIVWRPSTRYIT